MECFTLMKTLHVSAVRDEEVPCRVSLAGSSWLAPGLGALLDWGRLPRAGL